MSPRVFLERPSRRRQSEFIRLARQSRTFHRGWVTPPTAPDAFEAYLKRCRKRSYRSFFICVQDTRELAGMVSLSEIVRGTFLSAYLGYYAFRSTAGRGYMAEGLGLVLDVAFGEMGLHRVEANIQPGNDPSIRLVRSLGFRYEGFSPNYLKIAGRWRDHERWAILAEEWRPNR